MTPTKRLAAVAGLLAVVIPLSGCGTRMSGDKIAAADGSAISSQAANGDAAALGADTGVIAPTTTGTGAAGSVPGAVAPATTTGATTTGATGTGATGRAAGTKATGTKGGTAAGATGATVATGPNAPCKASLTPIVLGQTGAFSGIIGASIANIRTGTALWARAVNVRGGIQCHPVQMIQMDDAADPARVASNLAELVDKRKAVAIVGAGMPSTASSGRQFAERRRIPIIGSDLAEPTWYASPYLFPQGGSALANFAAATKAAGLASNGKNAGLIYCVEATICGTINHYFEDIARAAGMAVKASKVSSVTSPDYTAECQAMKAAGADVIFLVLEGSGASRFARSCRSLGMTTPIATSALAISDATSKDPNLQALGVYLGNGNAPFTEVDTPGGKEFRAAYDRFAPGSPLDQNSMTGWAAGKLVEAALAKVFEQARSGPVTTQLILEGLWQVKNETLNGIAPPLTFNQGGLPARNDCAYRLGIRTEGYFAPQGSKLECFKGLPPGF